MDLFDTVHACTPIDYISIKIKYDIQQYLLIYTQFMLVHAIDYISIIFIIHGFI